MRNSRSIHDYLLLLGVGLIWGGQFLVNAQVLGSLPPVTVAAGRVLIGALTLSLLSCRTHKRAPAAKGHSQTALFVLIAVFEAVLPLFLVVWGQQHVASGETAVIVGSVPIITLILSLFVNPSNFNRRSALSVVLGFAGIVVLINPGASPGESKLLHELAIVAGAVSFAISLLLLEKIPHGDPVRSARTILWTAAIFLTPAALVLDKPWLLTWSTDSVVALLMLGVVGSGMAYVMYAALTQRNGSVFASLSSFIVPLVGVLLGLAFCNEHFGYKQAIALVLIVGALAANELKQPAKKISPINKEQYDAST